MIFVEYEKEVRKFFNKNKQIEKRTKEKFLKLARVIEENNNSMENLQTNIDFAKMSGDNSKGEYRLRIGDYRALFTYFNQELLVRVFEIGSRGDIYK